MITWMQRHRKYLVVTIWISTIAFIGAGFVGWGQYDYGDKAGAVAKVGDISITQEDLQKSYSDLFNQYNQLFQGKLDQAQAKKFGLERQALKSLVDQALILNLARSYNITISDEELLSVITNQKIFTKNGKFDKQTYADVLRQMYNTEIVAFEDKLRTDLLIQKTLYLFAPSSNDFEKSSLAFAMGVSDKIEYKLLTPESVVLAPDESGLKAFWEKNKKSYTNPASYELSIAYPKIDPALSEEDADKEALRRYIDYKKGSLDPSVKIEKLTLADNSTQFSNELLKEIAALTNEKPYLKPRKVNNQYLIIKLDKKNPASPKTYEEAKNQANIEYSAQMKKEKLLELAKNSAKTFSGTVSDFITRQQSAPLAGLSPEESSEFVSKLFESKQKQGFVPLKDGNVIIYNVLAQKLLQDTTIADDNAVMKLKGNLLNEKLLKMLESKYPVKIYVEGI